jgi:Cu(I)/Ag(I) efflux system membrane fusion protein
MHPSVLQDRPGECPICGMDLVRVNGAPAPEAAATAHARDSDHGRAHAEGRYWCPMHPEVTSDDPNATCPKCNGMKLVPRDAAKMAKAAAAAGAGAYWCPMHPEIASDDPNATCPKCGGMKLQPRPGPRGRPGGPVPGLAAVEIDAERTQLTGMRTAGVARGRLAPQLRTVGFVTANESSVAIVAPRFTGWVEDLKVAQSGQRVEKGQVLATVYSPELLAAQQVYLNAARWAGDTASQAGGGAAAGQDADPRKRLQLLGVAKQDIDQLSKNGQPLSLMPVRAPVGGYIARKSALPGLYVTPGTELFQIADLSTVWVVADVYEHDMSRIAVGQRARLLLAAYPGESFTGKVQFIYPAVNPESRTLQARMEFKNPGMRLRPGMYGDVVIELEPAEGLMVPSEAVVDTGELQYVFLARPGGRFEPRVIRLGARGEERVQVLDGLAEGDVVVTTANFLVDSESRLRAAIEGFGAPHAERGESGERHEREHSEGTSARLERAVSRP